MMRFEKDDATGGRAAGSRKKKGTVCNGRPPRIDSCVICLCEKTLVSVCRDYASMLA